MLYYLHIKFEDNDVDKTIDKYFKSSKARTNYLNNFKKRRLNYATIKSYNCKESCDS